MSHLVSGSRVKSQTLNVRVTRKVHPGRCNSEINEFSVLGFLYKCHNG